MPVDLELVERLRGALAMVPVTEKRMFGGIAFLLDGHMVVAASHQGGMLVRVDPADAQALIELPGVRAMEMRGRPMAGWLRVPGGDEDAVTPWVDRALAYVGTLPPKG